MDPLEQNVSKAQSASNIDVLLTENRKFPPPPDFRAHALVRDDTMHARAARDYEGFWSEMADKLEWSRRWDKVLEWKPPRASWFLGGKLNVSVNCGSPHKRAKSE